MGIELLKTLLEDFVLEIYRHIEVLTYESRITLMDTAEELLGFCGHHELNYPSLYWNE